MEEIAQAFTSRQNFWDISTYKNILLIACSWDITGHISAVAWRSLKILTRGERSRNFASNGVFGFLKNPSRVDLRSKTRLKNPKNLGPVKAHLTGFFSPIGRNKDSWVGFGPKPTSGPNFTKIGVGRRTWPYIRLLLFLISVLLRLRLGWK